MSSKYTEKVICLYCNKPPTLKNLETHNKHDGKKLHYRSATSKDLSTLFGNVLVSNEDLLGNSTTQGTTSSVCDTTEVNLEPPVKIVCIDTEIKEKHEETPEYLSTKIDELSSQVKRLINICNKKRTEQIASDYVTDEFLNRMKSI